MTELKRNKRLATSWFDRVSDGDVETMCRLSAPDWRMHGGPPGLPTGHAGLRALFGHISPVEQKWTVDDVIAEGAPRRRARDQLLHTGGVLRRAGMGQAPSGHRDIHLPHRRRADRRSLRNADDLGRLLQLGARIVLGEE
jgi:hypothetical protein